MNTINQILKDLYEMDPSLKEHDEELRKVLQKMIEAQPDIQMDEEFVAMLREQLYEQAMIKTGKTLTRSGWIAKLAFGLSGAAVMALLFLTITRLPVSQSPLFSSSVKTVGQTAFDLSGGSASEGSPVASPQAESFSAPRAMNSGSGPVNDSVGNAGLTTASDMKIAPPFQEGEQVRYHYVFDGQLTLPADSQMNVFRRLPVSVNDSEFTKALKGFDFGLMDIGSFGKLKAEYISFLEDKEYGYSLQISFREGVININQNWNRWPNPYKDCADDACYQRLALKPEDVPADDVITGIADDFLKEHGINLEGYGSGRVLSQTPLYRFAADISSFVPEYITVIYPEEVDGKIVTESDGSPSGISVSVSVRDKKVTAVNNLRASNFEKSPYDTETDTTSLLDWAGKGGVNYYEYSDPAAKQVDVKLGEPEIVYFKFSKWIQNENRNEEYLIPAYSFLIQVPADYQLYRSHILVPLIKGFEDLNQEGGAVPVPLMMK